MKLYNFLDYENISVYGDIHGAFKTLFFDLLDKKRISRFLKTINKKKTNTKSIFVVAGDCTFGFNKLEYYNTLFKKYNEIFHDLNIHVLFIRGNHDDPSYFAEEKINFSNIKTIPDYSVIQTAKHNTLCVGGGISIDRSWRKEQETLLNRYKTDKTKKIYWENEQIIFDKDKLQELIDNNIMIDSIITHSSPSFAFPKKKEFIDDWIKIDNELKQDIKIERETLTKIYDFLNEHKMPPYIWMHGHFHKSNCACITPKNSDKQVKIISLDDNFTKFSLNDPFFQQEKNSIESCATNTIKINIDDFQPFFYDIIDIGQNNGRQ